MISVATFQVFHRHMWPVATVVGSEELRVAGKEQSSGRARQRPEGRELKS